MTVTQEVAPMKSVTGVERFLEAADYSSGGGASPVPRASIGP